MNFQDIFNRIQDLKIQLGVEPMRSPIPKSNGVRVVYPKDKPRAPLKMKVIDETVTPTIAPRKKIQPGMNVNLNPDVQKFIENTIFPITRKYEIPEPVAAGMFAAEGRLSGMGANRNNFYNIGAFDSDPNQANYFSTPEAGIEAFAKLLKEKKRYSKAFESRHDPVKMLEEIQNAGYAGDPKTYEQRAKNSFKSYFDFITATPEFKKYYK